MHKTGQKKVAYGEHERIFFLNICCKSAVTERSVKVSETYSYRLATTGSMASLTKGVSGPASWYQ